MDKLALQRNLNDSVNYHILTLLTCVIVLLLISGCSPDPSEVSVDSITNEAWYQDEVLLNKAWNLPSASNYKNNYVYQENRAFCGPASIVNVFNSIGLKSIKQSDIFDNTTIYYVKARLMGLTLDEINTLFSSNFNNREINGWRVTMLRDITLDQFRTHLRQSNNNDYRYVINFNRQSLFGVDIGHHSPIGGYIESEDLVFVLDVLDTYKPFFVKSERLYKAMNTVDSETGKKRGLVSIERLPQ